MSERREAIARRIRAMLQQTEENGCTKEEALNAAEMARKLLEEYNLTVDEVELRQSPFTKTAKQHTPDIVGERLWKPAQAVAALTGAKHWVSRKGSIPCDTFFGFKHEVEVAIYLLSICERAMRQEWSVLKKQYALLTATRQRLKIIPFLDGMADELQRRIIAMIPPKQTGKGLIVLHDDLLEAELKKLGIDLTKIKLRTSRDREEGYRAGREAAKKVALNPGLAREDEQRQYLGRN